MGLVRSRLFQFFGWNLVLLIASLEMKSVRGTDVPSSICPPAGFACTCSFLGEDGMEYPTAYDTPVLISCETSDIPAILDQLPKRLLVDMKLHVTPGADAQVLAPATFLNFSLLTHLDLSGNALAEIQPGAFHNAEMLVKLKLSENFLEELTAGLFSGTIAGGSGASSTYGLPALQELIIDNNNIAVLPDGVFESLTQLRYLDLSRNRIEQIGNFTFAGLHGLRILNLAGNILRETNSSMWRVLNDIEELNLSENEISRVDPDSFKELEKLYVLRLDQNQIENIDPPGLLSYSVSHVNMSHNSISILQYTFFHQDTYNMSWVNFDNNGLVTIEFHAWKSPDISELYLNNNNLGSITIPFLWSLERLTRLEMKNNHLYRIDDHMMGDLRSLRYLILDHNELNSLSNDIFNAEYDPRQRVQNPPASAILELSVDHNRLNQPTIEIMAAMRRMTHYSSNNNKIYQLRSIDFPVHESLVDLDFAFNQIVRIDNDAFTPLMALERVNLAGNQIQTIAMTAFPMIPTTLILDGNPLMCDCHVMWIRESVTFFGDETYCATPVSLENEALSSIQTSDLHCSIEMNGNITREVRRRQGSGVVLDCPVVPHTRAIIEWFISSYNYSEGRMNLEKLGPNSDGSMPQIFPNGSLHIKAIAHDSDTNYSCRATNNVDEKIFIIMLRVTKSNGTLNPNDIDPDSPMMVTNGNIMKYALGGTAGAVFLIGLIGVLLAFSLPASRNKKKEPDAIEKDQPEVDEVSKRSNCYSS